MSGPATEEAKFPMSGGNGLPPSPSRENPGQVYPMSDSTPASADEIPGTGSAPRNPTQVLSNPFMFQNTLEKIDAALSEAINEIASEERSFGQSNEEVTLLAKFRQWRDEVTAIKAGGAMSSGTFGHGAMDSAEKGSGLFVD